MNGITKTEITGRCASCPLVEESLQVALSLSPTYVAHFLHTGILFLGTVSTFNTLIKY